MRTTSSKLSAAVLVVVLSSGLIAPLASAMPRDGGPRRDEPIVRIIKQLLKHFGIGTNADELSVPRP
jgi:hypothetical protein